MPVCGSICCYVTVLSCPSEVVTRVMVRHGDIRRVISPVPWNVGLGGRSVLEEVPCNPQPVTSTSQLPPTLGEVHRLLMLNLTGSPLFSVVLLKNAVLKKRFLALNPEVFMIFQPRILMTIWMVWMS